MPNTVLTLRYVQTLLSQISSIYENPERFHLNSVQCKLVYDALKGLSAVLFNLSNVHPNAWKEIYRAVKEAEIYLQHCSSWQWPIKFLTRSTTGEAYFLHLHDLALCHLLLDVILLTDNSEICRKVFHFDQKMGRFTEIRHEYADEVELIKTCEQFSQRSTHISEDQNIVEVSKFLGEKVKGTIPIPDSTEVESVDADSPIPTWLKIDPADLVLESKIGEGSYGRVYEGSWLGIRVAAKEMSMDWGDVFESESSILAKLQSPFVVQLIGTCIKDSHYYLVMELVRSDLEQFLEKRSNGSRPPLSLPVAVDIMLQISRAMEYLHSQNIMHLDIKASNVLFELSSIPQLREEGYGRVKLCDFGTASPRLFSFRASFPKGTSNWRAPEVFPRSCEDLCSETDTPEKYTSKADVYSFAMTCYEILTGKKPFPDLPAREIQAKIMKGERPTLGPSICPVILANYIQQCWHTDPNRRPCFEAVSNFLRKLKLCILKSSLDWQDAFYRGFDPGFGFVDNDKESIFSGKLRKWQDANLVAMHSRLDEMLFIWRFLTLEMRRGIAIDIASFLARRHEHMAKGFSHLCLDSSTIYLDWKSKPIFCGVASGKRLPRRGKKNTQVKRVEEFKNVQDFGRILVELFTGCTWKGLRTISIQRWPPVVDQQLVEEMEKLVKRQLREEVDRWWKLGLWCQSLSEPPSIHTVLRLLKGDNPSDLPGDSTLQDCLSSIRTIEKLRYCTYPYADQYPDKEALFSIGWRRKSVLPKQSNFRRNGWDLLRSLISSPIEGTRIFSLDQIEKATHNFAESLALGTDSYGCIYKGRLPDGLDVAIKKFESLEVDSKEAEEFRINEIVILGKINHRNVVKLLGYCLETPVPLLVYEYIPNGTLFEHLQEDKYEQSLKWEDRLRIATETAETLSYLHSATSEPIIHRDVKSSNILLDGVCTPKVTNFGFSRLVPVDQTHITTLVKGTLGYLDPQYFQTCLLTEKSDVYSFGVVLVELLTGLKPYERMRKDSILTTFFLSKMKTQDLADILDSRFNLEDTKTVDSMERVAELAKECLSVEGEKRPTMKDVAEELLWIRRGNTGHAWSYGNAPENEEMVAPTVEYKERSDGVQAGTTMTELSMLQSVFGPSGEDLLQSLMSFLGEGTRIFSLDQIEDATDKFAESLVVGIGVFGCVYKGRLPDGLDVAIKKFHDVEIDSKQNQLYINDIVMLSKINHRNVVKLLGCCLETSAPVLVYEYISNGTLFEHLHGFMNEQSLKWEDRLSIATETAEALSYLHSATSIPIIHRDVKSSNILLDSGCTPKVINFVISSFVPVDQTHITTAVKGTPGYWDPEYFQTCQLTKKSDVYSFGVVLVELLTGFEPYELTTKESSLTRIFLSRMETQNLADILDSRLNLEDAKIVDSMERVAKLAKECLNMKGKKRPSMKEVVQELLWIRGGNTTHTWSDDNAPENEAEMVARIVEYEKIGDRVQAGTEMGELSMLQSNGGDRLQSLVSSLRDATRVFSVDEMEKATNKFAESLVLGTGGYGTVYKGTLSDGTIVAIKKSKSLEVDSNEIDQFINEAVILSQINHRNVVKLLGLCFETPFPLLVYEYISNGTVCDHLYGVKCEQSLQWEDRLRIATETAEALSFLHCSGSVPIVHRDVKSSNILLDHGLTPKVADFGVSQLVPMDQTHATTVVRGTLGYLDPEYFLTFQITEKSDVYSFEVVLVELLTGLKPVSVQRTKNNTNLAIYFLSKMKTQDLADILDSRLDSRNAESMQRVAMLAKECLSMEGEKRPTMKEVVQELLSIGGGSRADAWSDGNAAPNGEDMAPRTVEE